MKVKFILQGSAILNPITVICDDKNMSHMEKLFAFCMSSKACENELSKLSEIPDVTVDFSRDDLRFQGEWLSAVKEIRVKKNLSLEKTLQTFLFELCNALNPALTQSNLRYSNFSTANAYATYIEGAEHQSFLKTCSLYWDIWSQHSDSLEIQDEDEVQQIKKLYNYSTYLDYVKANGHYDHYVSQYTNSMSRRDGFFHNPNKQPLDIKHGTSTSSFDMHLSSFSCL